MKKEKKQTLGFLLARASNAMAANLNSLLKNEGIDLPHSQYVILKTLYEEDGISQQELAERVYKNVAAIKRTLDILENKGLVKRIPVSMRKNSIVITQAGKELIPEVMDCIDKSKQSILAGISNEEYNTFISVLARIYHNIK